MFLQFILELFKQILFYMIDMAHLWAIQLIMVHIRVFLLLLEILFIISPSIQILLGIMG